jgi:hypothetical protein
MQTHSIQLQVITDANGKVVGTKPSASPEPSLGIEGYSQLVAGPEQEQHDVEVEISEHLLESWNVTELHEIVQNQIDQTRSRNA